jgi:hypothetical protein
MFYFCSERSEGAYHQWRKIPPRELSICQLTSGFWLGDCRVGGRHKGRLWAVERSSGP